jgi:hypothetical protein
MIAEGQTWLGVRHSPISGIVGTLDAEIPERFDVLIVECVHGRIGLWRCQFDTKDGDAQTYIENEAHIMTGRLARKV